MPSLSELLGPDAPWPGLLSLLAVIAAAGLMVRLWLSRGSEPPAAVIAVLGSTLAAFCLIAWQVHVQGPLAGLDVALVQWLQMHRTDRLTDVLRVVTELHDPWPITALMVGFGLLLLARRQYRWMAAFVLVTGGGTTLNVILKQLFVRARFIDNQSVLPAFTSFSFPSGHVAATTLLYGFIATYLLATLDHRPARQLALGLSIAMIGLVAFSRVYLGAHYLSDVLAAALLAIFWMRLSDFVVRGHPGPREMPR